MRVFHDSAEIIRATQGEILVYYIPIGKTEIDAGRAANHKVL
jgi:hypothetical protein